MEKQINPENIQTVGELIDFLQSTDLFCEEGIKRAIKFFSEFKENELIDNIENIPNDLILSFCEKIKGKTIERFRNKINTDKYAYLWAFEFGGEEIDLIRDKVKNNYYVYLWACRFRGKEIELMRSKITDDLYAYLWACEFKGAEIDYMLNIIKDKKYKNELLELKQIVDKKKGLTIETQINPENIQTVGELIDFLVTTDLFCEKEKQNAIKFFSRFDRNELIDNIEDIPDRWVVCFCRAIRGKTIDRFRYRIKSSESAYRWAFEFKGEEIELMKPKIKDAYWAYRWVSYFGKADIDYMLNNITKLPE